MNLEDLQVALKVAELKSITAAATHLNMHTATASAALKRVETGLGAELFIRTTRQLRLSSAGEKYLPLCKQAFAMLEQARTNIRDDQDVVEGDLRLAVSSDLGRNLVAPWLDEFMQLHPGIRLKLNISDSNVDFYRDAVDVALRYGSPKEAHLYGFKICDVQALLCASPEYLDKYGAPTHPHELASHNGLFYQLQDVIHDQWSFTSTADGKDYKIKMSGNRAANDGDLVRRWCASGKGLAVKSCLDMSAELLSGKVVSLMPGYQPRKTELWLICPSRQSITPAVRLLRDALQQKSQALIQQLVDKKILNTQHGHTAF